MPSSFSPERHHLPEVIEPQSWNQYRARLHTTLRWQGGHPPANPEFSESVLQHVEDAIKLTDESFSRYPDLALSLRPLVVKNILWGHDAVEMLKGDIPCTVESISTEKKSLEEWVGVVTCAFPLLIPANGIEPSSILREFMEMFLAFETMNSDSPWAKEAMFARVIDTMQGGVTALRELYPDSQHILARSSVEKFGLPRILYPGNHLAQALEGESQSHKAFLAFVVDHLREYYHGSYSSQVVEGLQRYEHLTPLLQML